MAEGGVLANDKNCELELINTIECAVCLQTCVHPAELPCGHIFCFLCIKGIAFQSGRCAMCREDIPMEFLFMPKLLAPLKPDSLADTYQWYYEGNSGWWQYDQRASAEIEEAYNKGEKVCQLLLAGFLYVIDFNNMVQFRQTHPMRRRRIKRDRSTTDKLGVAGLTENVLKKRMEEVESGLQRLWADAENCPEAHSSNRSVQPGAENLTPTNMARFSRSDNDGFESLEPEECQEDFRFRALSPSERDGRCFNPRLDLDESGDEESDGTDEAEADEPRPIMSGPSAALTAALRPLPVRAQDHPHSASDLEIIDNSK